MHVQCIICQELFDNNNENEAIAALHCGHTFHNACLNQWLENGRTCPSCRVPVDRKKLIQRLYFHVPVEDVDKADNSQLLNKIESLKHELLEKDQAKVEVVKEKEQLKSQFTKLENNKEKLEVQLYKLQATHSALNATNGTLRREIESHVGKGKRLEQERQEMKRVRQKLISLEHLDALMNGVESEVSDVVSREGTGANAVQSLSRQLVFLKREYEKQKVEKQDMKKKLEKILRREEDAAEQVPVLTQEVQNLKSRLERVHGDLKLSEKHYELLKIRYRNLKTKLHDAKTKGGEDVGAELKTDTSFTDLLNESAKLRAFASSTPKLSSESQGNNHGDFEDPDSSMVDLFASPVEASAKPYTNALQENSNENCENIPKSCHSQRDLRPTQSKLGIRLTSCSNKVGASSLEDDGEVKIKITSNSQKFKRFKSDSTLQESNPVLNFANMNILKKRKLGADGYSQRGSIVQCGYDGLGGHTTHINNLGNPFVKPASKPVVKRSATKSSMFSSHAKGAAKTSIFSSQGTKTPMLPKLDKFIVID